MSSLFIIHLIPIEPEPGVEEPQIYRGDKSSKQKLLSNALLDILPNNQQKVSQLKTGIMPLFNGSDMDGSFSSQGNWSG